MTYMNVMINRHAETVKSPVSAVMRSGCIYTHVFMHVVERVPHGSNDLRHFTKAGARVLTFDCRLGVAEKQRIRRYRSAMFRNPHAFTLLSLIYQSIRRLSAVIWSSFIVITYQLYFPESSIKPVNSETKKLPAYEENKYQHKSSCT